MWTVYLIRCKDDSLYAGITTDLEARLDADDAGSETSVGRATNQLTSLSRHRSRVDLLASVFRE